MKDTSAPTPCFPSAAEDAASARLSREDSPSYKLAYSDEHFLLRDELRAVRLQLEWLKPDLILEEQGIESTVVVFGSSRFPHPDEARAQLQCAERQLQEQPEDRELQRALAVARNVMNNSRYYEEACKLARLITQASLKLDGRHYVVTTGGGPGIMEAANRGAAEAGGNNIGLNIVLPFEQAPNVHITRGLCFQFHYFAMRKMHFLKRAAALISFPGGFGTLDEVFETLTLIQTRKIKRLPVILVGREYWNRLIDFDFLVEQGAIHEEDAAMFNIVESADEAWSILKSAWNIT